MNRCDYEQLFANIGNVTLDSLIDIMIKTNLSIFPSYKGTVNSKIGYKYSGVADGIILEDGENHVYDELYDFSTFKYDRNNFDNRETCKIIDAVISIIKSKNRLLDLTIKSVSKLNHYSFKTLSILRKELANRKNPNYGEYEYIDGDKFIIIKCEIGEEELEYGATSDDGYYYIFGYASKSDKIFRTFCNIGRYYEVPWVKDLFYRIKELKEKGEI